MSEKNGGPYTKEEQESRRLKVYEMHFQKSMPAVQIAKEIGCNRNTVNEDIKYWLSQIGSIFGKKTVYNATIEEMEILKNQRNELLEESNSYDVGDKLRAKKNAIPITSAAGREAGLENTVPNVFAESFQGIMLINGLTLRHVAIKF